jgi:hypothetical protein
MSLLDLDAIWNRIEGASEDIRSKRSVELVERLGNRISLSHQGLALAVAANERMSGVSMHRLDSGRAELLAWTTARVLDAYREYASGNFAGGLVQHRAAVEGYTTLAAILLDHSLAERFAAFGFVSQAEARKAADSSHPNFNGTVPMGLEDAAGENIQGRLYKSLSTMAHPTRFSSFFQSEPEALSPQEVQDLPRSWVLVSANWPKNTDWALRHLIELALSLAETVTHLPLPVEELSLLMDRREKLGAELQTRWPAAIELA